MSRRPRLGSAHPARQAPGEGRHSLSTQVSSLTGNRVRSSAHPAHCSPRRGLGPFSASGHKRTLANICARPLGAWSQATAVAPAPNLRAAPDVQALKAEIRTQMPSSGEGQDDFERQLTHFYSPLAALPADGHGLGLQFVGLG